MKTLLVETIPLLREALVRHLSSDPNNLLLANTGNYLELMPLLEKYQPELLWLDGSFAEIKISDLLRNIRQMAPRARILLFGSNETIPEIKKYFQQGIHAYLPKIANADDISAALSNLAQGNLYVPPSLNRAFMLWIIDPMHKKKRGSELTQREREILSLIVEEHTTGEIAKKLFISYCTVETHRVNLIQKLGVKNTAGLVRVAFETGLYNRGII